MATMEELLTSLEGFKADIKGIKELVEQRPANEMVTKEIKDALDERQTKIDETLAEINRKLEARGSETNDVKAKAEKAVADFIRGSIESLPKASISVGNGNDGGYLIPDEVAAEIDHIAGTESALYNLANVGSTNAEKFKKRVRTSGSGAEWVEEGGTRSDTDSPTFDIVTIDQHTIYAEPGITNEALGDDDGTLVSELTDSIGESFGEKQADAFMNGNGVGKPHGICAYSKKYITKRADMTWGKINCLKTGVANDFPATKPFSVFASASVFLKNRYKTGASWIMNSTTYAEILKWTDADGRPLIAQPINDSYDGMLYGKQIHIDDYMPDYSAGGVFAVIGDYKKGYYIRNHRGMISIRDQVTSKGFTKFYTEKRVGGGVVDFMSMIFVTAEA